MSNIHFRQLRFVQVRTRRSRIHYLPLPRPGRRQRSHIREYFPTLKARWIGLYLLYST